MTQEQTSAPIPPPATYNILGREVPRTLFRGVCTGFILFISTLFFRGCCVTEVDSHELGYRYDRRTGRINVLPRTGYVVYPPLFVSVHTIDLRPMQVCITGSDSSMSSVNSRVLNCKLVRFNRNGLELFLSWHGREDYDYDKLSPILRNYAYDGSGRHYPFLDVLRELRGDAEPIPNSVQGDGGVRNP